MAREIFTGSFWGDAVERALKTAAQALITLWGATDVFNLFSIDWAGSLGVAGGMALLSLLMSIGSAKVTNTDNASLVK